jgi:hypothetical protein
VAAEPAGAAGDDLLRDDVVADVDAVQLGGAVAQIDDRAREFVPGDDRRLAVAAGAAFAPEQRCAAVAL